MAMKYFYFTISRPLTAQKKPVVKSLTSIMLEINNLFDFLWRNMAHYLFVTYSAIQCINLRMIKNKKCDI